MDISSISKLPTKRLLAYYKAERKRRQLPKFDEDESYYKVDLKDIKKLLDDREHIEKNK